MSCLTFNTSDDSDTGSILSPVYRTRQLLSIVVRLALRHRSLQLPRTCSQHGKGASFGRDFILEPPCWPSLLAGAMRPISTLLIPIH